MRIEYMAVAMGPAVRRMPGDILDVSKKEAESLIAGGYAKSAIGPASRQLETATAGPSENASARAGRPRTSAEE